MITTLSFPHPGRWPLLLIAALALAGCSRPQDRFFPLDKGRLWVYGLTLKTGQGSRTLKHVVENLGHGVLDGHKVFLQQFANGVTRYYRVDPKAILSIAQSMPDQSTAVFPEPKMVLPIPATASSPSWTDQEYTRVLQRGGPPKANLHIDIHVRMKITYTVTGEDSQVAVPAGRYSHCLRVQGTGETQRDVGSPIGPITIYVKTTKWYAPGTGLVKVLRTESTSSPIVPAGELQMELEHVRPG